jgi:hypothetical protein
MRGSSSVRPAVTTSSMSHFDDSGRTRLATRLTSISVSPSARRRRCFQRSSRASRHAADADTRFFCGFVTDS